MDNKEKKLFLKGEYYEKIKWTTLVVSVCLILGLFAGCNKEENGEVEKPVELTDDQKI